MDESTESGAHPHHSSDDRIIQERKEKFLAFFRQRKHWAAYIGLALVVFIALYIRTLPMHVNPATGHPGLWDITTNTWTLGPDLDPFLFLRWAKYIVAHGHLMSDDTFRYVPLGFKTAGELFMLPYLIAFFHTITTWFGNTSVEYSAVLFPAVMFGLTVIAFFLFVRRVFVDDLGKSRANWIGLIASLFFSVVPTFLPRTIAGIPEKESAAFFFMFLAFYFILKAWKSEKLHRAIIFSTLAALATAGMAMVWGGYVYIYLIIGVAGLAAFLLGTITRQRIIAFSIWLIVGFLVIPFISRYSMLELITSTTTSIALFALLVMIVDAVLSRMRVPEILHQKHLKKLPRPVLVIVATAIVCLLGATLVLGFNFVFDTFEGITRLFIQPISDRLGVTVAENRQPYFNEWGGEFGPLFGNIPLFFSLFMIGSVYLYWNLTKHFPQKTRMILTGGYTLFLCSLVFSRYSSSSILNGENFISILFYLVGIGVFLGTFGYYYYKNYHTEERSILQRIDIGELLVFAFFFLALVSARGAVRLTMMVVPPASIMVGYLIVMLVVKTFHAKTAENKRKVTLMIVTALVIIASVMTAYQFYRSSAAMATNYVPSVYTQQWQQAMAWVRVNTPQNAVFAHWWDYGYWVQSLGERATVLDGGNQYAYWDYLMGRYGLTSSDDYATAEYLYAHNVTHFLIDSSDIGKYSAFSSIGSSADYDRASYIPTLQADQQYTQELKNSTRMVYTGGFSLDQDIIYLLNGTRLFLPEGQAGLGAVSLERNKAGRLVKQPEGIYVYQGAQYTLPMRYAYDNNTFYDFGSGVEAGVFVYPKLIQGTSGFQVDMNGALLYLSNKTVKSQVARRYLYQQNDSLFTLVHTQDDLIIAQLKAQNPEFHSDFLEYGGFRGPIRIWEIHYPQGLQVKQEYLATRYPDPALARTR